MKRIAIIGSNIFAFGGTTRSNLNLFNEFESREFQLTYYNYVDYSQRELNQFRKKNPRTKSVKFKKFHELFNRSSKLNFDYVFITRESFLAVAELIRFKSPQAIIVGEIHTPLSQLPDNLDGLDYLSCVRVATSSIAESFCKKYNFNRIYVQTVSLSHLKWVAPKRKPTQTFLIHSRFDDLQKDISYSIDLIEYLIKKSGQNRICLYLNGSGPDKKTYANLVKKKHLGDHVIINKVQPKDYIYLSTARVETLGYSIVEAVSQGHLVAAYSGDDRVVYENLKDLPAITWLNKDLEHDAKLIEKLTEHYPDPADFKISESVLKKLSSDYTNKMIARTKPFKNSGQSVSKSVLDTAKIKQKLNGLNGSSKAPWYIKSYRFALTFPILKKILNLIRS